MALLIALVFWQLATRRHKAQMYTAEIEKPIDIEHIFTALGGIIDPDSKEYKK